LRQPRIRPVVDAPAPQPPGNDKSRRKQLLAVGAAFVAVAAALIGINVKSAANEQPAGAPAVTVTSVSAATSAVSVPPTPTSSLQKLAAANPVDYPRATYAAHLPDGAGSLYLAMRDGEAIAYLCDGRKIEAWFDGTAVAGKLTLTGKKGSTLTGSFDSARATGKVVVGGKTVSFTIPVVHKPSGLYRAATQVRNADVQGGWIVLADGSQVGVVTIDGTPQPAPALDTVGRTATIDGTTVSASEIDIDSGSGF
jgi:serine/threonine-protein kinase